MAPIMSALVLLLTVVAAVCLGIVLAYGVLSGILVAFASRPKTSPVVLVPSENPAGGA